MTQKKIKARSLKKNAGKIPDKQPQYDDEVIFSFKYLDLFSNPKFSIAGCGYSYLEKLLLRLKDVSSIRYDDFVNMRSSSLRSHKITWEETTEPDGFTNLNSQLREQTAFQFEISANEHGRVHGFLLNRIFYIVWLDPHHNLYS
ncbi:MAG: hypothetical protein DSM107014_11030 [Gomphosphaeria aponina SAG 52.96 = DSM 107014]|uniref:Uncharacterized protein n=1 Tax=Gomphosphaeria aponina SAG 52.96 = DSM 107014 TaxID=1521640 RepID=A0A941GRB5_9CHRO|nr:hypothetical protein [Gomphosphaeria aponina SAG 52.96 = DSM 107014]